ncbi:MAG TPA: MotA/TolQ/ExbB proton channel family protein [bacterium]|nr:MotA/TolQ/ExbB proton channel family protein [bacterium]HMW34969.1 MotA/TolQ/ExbB proton channel family protein [bacterium]HMY36159.1 MotA/TolQ/ExbB proton channel family protein [bacterium]HMZ03725.1 MotA/TolQ/ExbB proton channel family protein [bacterium]HNB56154.1 MotA/TolQ/ExbB proton channel family protein [bacterium]
MKQSVFMSILITTAFIVSYLVFEFIFGAEGDKYGLHYIYAGGPLVVILMVLSIMVVTFIFERIFSLRKANGKDSLPFFLKKIQKSLMDGNVETSIEVCDHQKGSCANIIKMGLEAFQRGSKMGMNMEKRVTETKRAIEEATSLEVPLLERNLIALSTIASISTMVGLLGTTLGMIRAFKALAQSGAPDAVSLSLGISEALINTAGGLGAAIVAIVAYNYFVNKVDTYTYLIDEASYNVVEILTTTHGDDKN